MTGRTFDDHVIIIPKLFFSWMVGKRSDAGINLLYLTILPRGTPANIRIYLTFLVTRIKGLHLAADSMGLSSLNGLCKTLFLQE